jgi:hypothetical protein
VRLVWHIVKKDLRRMWLPLALWLLLLLAKNKLGALALAHDGVNLNSFEGLEFLSTVVLGLEILVNVVLVAVLVQEDTLVGTRMFWATRPVGGGRLLAAKLISVGLMFGVLPVLAAWQWWWHNGYGAPQIARAIWTTLDWQALTVLPALVLAVLTENPLKFFGALLGLVVALSAVMLLIPLLNGSDTRFGVTGGVMKTRITLGLFTFIVGTAAVIVSQFFTRRLRWAVAALVLTMLARIFSARWWPWDWTGGRERRQPAALAGITIEPALGWSEPANDAVQWRAHPVNETEQFIVDYIVRGVPEDLGVDGHVESIWRWPSGETAARYDRLMVEWPGWAEWRALKLPGGKNDPVVQAWTHSGKEQPEEREVNGGVRLRAQFFLSPTDWTKLRANAPAFALAFSADVPLVLLRPTQEFEIPLRQGATAYWAGNRVRVAVAEWRDGRLAIAVIESEAWLSDYCAWRPGLTSPIVNREGHENLGFSLVNRARGEAIKLWEHQRRRSLHIGTQWINWRMFSCVLPRDADEPTGRPPRWLDGATLAGVRFHAVEQFDREVKMARFETRPR